MDANNDAGKEANAEDVLEWDEVIFCCEEFESATWSKWVLSWSNSRIWGLWESIFWSWANKKDMGEKRKRE